MHPDLVNQRDGRIYNQSKHDVWSLLLSLIEIESGEIGTAIERSQKCLKKFDQNCFETLFRKILRFFKIEDECYNLQNTLQK